MHCYVITLHRSSARYDIMQSPLAFTGTYVACTAMSSNLHYCFGVTRTRLQRISVARSSFQTLYVNTIYDLKVSGKYFVFTKMFSMIIVQRKQTKVADNKLGLVKLNNYFVRNRNRRN